MSQFRFMNLKGVGVLLGVVAVGCGARTELYDEPLPRPTPKPAAAAAPKPAAPPKPAPSSGTPVGGDSSIGTSNMLGECKLGAAVQAGKECPYLAQNRCYPDIASACACVCPRNAGDTTCTEGFFPDANGSIAVNCF